MIAKKTMTDKFACEAEFRQWVNMLGKFSEVRPLPIGGSAKVQRFLIFLAPAKWYVYISPILPMPLDSISTGYEAQFVDMHGNTLYDTTIHSIDEEYLK